MPICSACPFAFTDRSEEVQNYGCLPSPFEILKIKSESGHNWSCHDNPNKLCAGYANHIAKYRTDLNIKQGNLINYEIWYRQGEAAAIAQASTPNL